MVDHAENGKTTHNKEGRNYLEHESNRHKTIEDIDGGLHLAKGK